MESECIQCGKVVVDYNKSLCCTGCNEADTKRDLLNDLFTVENKLISIKATLNRLANKSNDADANAACEYVSMAMARIKTSIKNAEGR